MPASCRDQVLQQAHRADTKRARGDRAPAREQRQLGTAAAHVDIEVGPVAAELPLQVIRIDDLGLELAADDLQVDLAALADALCDGIAIGRLTHRRGRAGHVVEGLVGLDQVAEAGHGTDQPLCLAGSDLVAGEGVVTEPQRDAYQRLLLEECGLALLFEHARQQQADGIGADVDGGKLQGANLTEESSAGGGRDTWSATHAAASTGQVCETSGGEPGPELTELQQGRPLLVTHIDTEPIL